MNILLINHYAGSNILGMEYRPYYLAKEWIKLGHDVTIIAASFAHVRSKQPNIRNDFHEEIIEGIRYLWIKTPKYNGNGLKRTFNMFTFVYKLWTKARKISKTYNPDIVIASSTYPSDNYPAHKIAAISNAKHIYEVHDLWPLSPIELGGMSKKHPFIRLMQHAEDFAYSKANKVISILPKTMEYMQSRGMDPDKWHYIPNGICEDEWDDAEKIPEKIKDYILTIRSYSKKTVAYTGSVGIANALHNFVYAAEKLKVDNIAFFIIGHGPELDNLIKIKRDRNIDNLYFIEPIPKKSIPNLLSLFDYLYIGLQHQSLFRFGISPNKLIDYLMSVKPVIQAIDAGNNIVNDARCGISIEPENPDRLVEAITKLSKKSSKELEEMGRNGRNYVLKNHLYSKLAKDFIDCI